MYFCDVKILENNYNRHVYEKNKVSFILSGLGIVRLLG